MKTAAGDVALTVFFSAFSDNAYSRQDVVVASISGAPVVFGPGIQKLSGETVSLDKAKGSLAVWGKGAAKSGEIGLAAIFPPADLAAVDDSGLDRASSSTPAPDASSPIGSPGPGSAASPPPASPRPRTGPSGSQTWPRGSWSR